MPDFRKGAEAIAAAQERAKSGGSFRPFVPSLFWSQGDERYLLFLNPLSEVVQVDLIGFIPVEVKGRDKPIYEQVIARTDPAIDEAVDPMARDWGADPRETNIALAVELEPEFEEVAGRKRPVGFKVATNDYDRRIRNDEGELTEETETVTTPVIGFVTQSPHNFFNLVTSVDAKDGPIESTPMSIERVDKNTYNARAFVDQDVDLGDLIEYIDGVSWLGDDLDALLDEIEKTEDDQEAALIIGQFFLEKRLDELCDRARYDELYEGIDKPFKYGTKAKKEDKKSSRRERPARRTQRRSSESEPETTDEAPEATDEAPAEEEKPKRTRRTKKETPAAEAEEKPKGRARQGSAESTKKLEELRARAAARKTPA